ncbi:FUSC family protein [Candidatus Solirubrobacter pratensis]|uniref:FUSC family protein n=1 Tax=Candidatus Solirubrobacter pratensis TaxID=1298857 RepID=UPI0004262DD1|nr:FUSC family protein [Candidatus Solirubrobacter pratensis]
MFQPLIEEATERSRVSMRSRLVRLRVSWRTMVQASVAAALAWLFATEVWGHQAPFFAPVSAIIALGQSYHQRGRRAAELVIGVSLGIALSDVLLSQIGTGTIQLAIVVFLAMGMGLLFTSSQLFVNQAAVSAALVATIQPPSSGITFARSVDALTGGSIALAVAALLLPTDPQRILRDASRPVLEELAATLRDVARALAARDLDAAGAALDRARGIDDLSGKFADAVREGRETARYSVARRGARGTIEAFAGAAAQIDLAVRNVRVLARGAIRALTLKENVPEEVPEALEDLADAVIALERTLADDGSPEAVREPALRAAATATLVLERTGNLSVSVIVGQIRSTAVDLLTGSGMDPPAAVDAVRAAVRAAQERA